MTALNPLSPRILAVLLMVLSLGLSSGAFAQKKPKEAPPEDEGYLIALLRVPDGGTEMLTKEFEALDPEVEVKDQGWFIKQVKARGIKPKKLLRRPDDLRWVIKGAKISLIVYLKPVEDDDKYDVTFVGKKGKNVEEFQVEKTEDGLTEDGAKEIAGRLKKELKIGAPTVAIAMIDEVDPAEGDASKLKDDAKAHEEDIDDRLSQDWLFMRVAGKLLKRDLNITGANGAVLSYASSFYPGFEIEVESYPGAPVDEKYSAFGVFANYLMGFGSVRAEGADAGSVVDLPITQMEIEGGTKFRLVSPIGQESSTTMVQAQIKASVRYSSFSVEANRSLPKTSMVEVIIGASVLYPVLVDGFAVTGSFDVTPIGFWGDSGNLFGESSYTYGFAASLGGVYAATESLGIVFGYRYRVLRTAFEGQGELDFRDSDAFELVQAANIGIVYQY